MEILVMSCDNNEDLWEPFHYFTEKYWPDHPKINYLTEKKDNKFYNTIKVDYPISSWSHRVRDAVKQIEDDVVMIICDDLFIYNPVDVNTLNEMVSIIDENTGSVNLHRRFSVKEEYISDHLQKRPKGAVYNCSVMCSVWNRKNLIKVFEYNSDPGHFEKNVNDLGLDYYVFNSKYDFLKFREPDNFLFGLWRGQGSRHCVNLFEREGIQMNYNIRGIYD